MGWQEEEEQRQGEKEQREGGRTAGEDTSLVRTRWEGAILLTAPDDFIHHTLVNRDDGDRATAGLDTVLKTSDNEGS